MELPQYSQNDEMTKLDCRFKSSINNRGESKKQLEQAVGGQPIRKSPLLPVTLRRTLTRGVRYKHIDHFTEGFILMHTDRNTSVACKLVFKILPDYIK
jgi:hypothetical protein